MLEPVLDPELIVMGIRQPDDSPIVVNPDPDMPTVPGIEKANHFALQRVGQFTLEFKMLGFERHV